MDNICEVCTHGTDCIIGIRCDLSNEFSVANSCDNFNADLTEELVCQLCKHCKIESKYNGSYSIYKAYCDQIIDSSGRPTYITYEVFRNCNKFER